MQRGKNRVVCLLSGPLAAVGQASAGAPVGVEGGMVSLPFLDANAERASLVSALREGCAETGREIELQIRYATLDALRSAVTLGVRVVHFSGHGHPSFLCFEDGRGGAAAASPEQLRRLVTAGGTGTLRLVVVNSCHSLKAGSAFVEAGVPHVVAVKCSADGNGKVSDKAATAFCRAFYLGVIGGRSVREAFEIGSESANEHDRPGNDGTYVLLPEDASHEEHIFVDAPKGSLKVNAPKRTPCNAPAMPTYIVGRDKELFCLVDAMLRHRLTSVTGNYGSGKSAITAVAAHYLANRGNHFEAVVWVKLTSRKRLVDDVLEAARRVLSSSEDHNEDNVEKGSTSFSKGVFSATGTERPSLRRRKSLDPEASKRSSSSGASVDQSQPLLPSQLSSSVERVASFSSLMGAALTDEDSEDGAGASKSAAANFLCNNKVLIVLDDLEKITTPRLNAANTLASCQRALNSLLANASEAHVVVTCKRGSGLGRSTSVTEHVIKVNPLNLKDAAKLLLLRSPELARRATNIKAARSPRSPPDSLVASAAGHPVFRKLAGNPLAIGLSATMLNSLFEIEDRALTAARDALANLMTRRRISRSKSRVNTLPDRSSSSRGSESSESKAMPAAITDAEGGSSSSSAPVQATRPLEPLDRLLHILEQSPEGYEDESYNKEILRLRDDINAAISQEPLDNEFDDATTRTQPSMTSGNSFNYLTAMAGGKSSVSSHSATMGGAGNSPFKTAQTSLALSENEPPPLSQTAVTVSSSELQSPPETTEGSTQDTASQRSRQMSIDRPTFNIFAISLGVVWLARLFLDAHWPQSSPLTLRLDAVVHLFIDIALLAVLASLLPPDEGYLGDTQRRP